MKLTVEPLFPLFAHGELYFVPIETKGTHSYTYRVHFPFLYPLSKNGIRHISTEPMSGTMSGEPAPGVAETRTIERHVPQGVIANSDTRPAPHAVAGDFAKHPHRGATAAVLMFDARGGLSSDEVSLLTDRFAIELGRAEVYRLVSQSKMKEVLNFNQMATSCTSMACAVEAGQILGVEYIVYASIGKIGSLYTINVYAASVERGEIVASDVVDHFGQIESLLTDGMSQAACKLLLKSQEVK